LYWDLFLTWLGLGQNREPRIQRRVQEEVFSLSQALNAWTTEHSQGAPHANRRRVTCWASPKQRYAKRRPKPPLKPNHLAWQQRQRNQELQATAQFQHTRSQLLALVGATDAGPVKECFDYHRDPYLRRYALPDDGPNIKVSDKKLDIGYPSWEMATRGEPELQHLHELIQAAASKRLYQPKTITLDEVYSLYSKLPEPRMLSITYKLRGMLLQAFGSPGTRDARSMLRYFALVGDVKKAGLPIRLREWNFALSLASRYVRKTSKTELVTAMQLWKEMEGDRGVMANEVTFNILFDVASKAHDFALAEAVYKEMDARGIPFNRYHYVSLIHFFGLKQDGDGVRAAYREMVEDGEIIDPVVLNCVIASLLRSGEDDAAAEIYERMKSVGSSKDQELPIAREPMPMPPAGHEWGGNRLVRKVFAMYGRLSKQHPGMNLQLQATASLAPDLQTFRILTDHFGVKRGDVTRLSRYLDDMTSLRLPLHGAIYSAIFRAFAAHGGGTGMDWTELRLKGVFQSMLDAVDNGVEGLTIEVRLAMQVIHAFRRCSSDEATKEALEQMMQRMKLTVGQETFLEDVLHNALAGKEKRRKPPQSQRPRPHHIVRAKRQEGF